MGLFARKDFIGNEGRQYKAGDPCDEALRWRYPALRACLNQGLIEDTTGEVEKYFARPSRVRGIDTLSVVDLNLDLPGAVLGLEEKSEAVACEHCDKVYKNSHGLNIHRKRMHRE